MRRGASGINALIGIDKPVGLSSHDVVNRVRRILGERRVGHAGTLDPLASGVLIIGVGQAARLLGLITADNKRYLARFSFGRETQTDDEEGQTTREAPAPAKVLDADYAREQMSILTAMTSQVPPTYSAISVNGKRAYTLAREGKQVELEPRHIEVFDAMLLATGADQETSEPYWDVITTVSKGTYVRTMARDLGRALNSACHLGGLRRLAIGDVSLAQCTTLEKLEELSGNLEDISWLDPLVATGLAKVELSSNDVHRVISGLPVAPSRLELDSQTYGLSYDGRLYAIAEVKSGLLEPKMVFADGIRGLTTGATDDE